MNDTKITDALFYLECMCHADESCNAIALVKEYVKKIEREARVLAELEAMLKAKEGGATLSTLVDKYERGRWQGRVDALDKIAELRGKV